MLTSQRKKLILTRLANEGQIVAKDLAYELGTSEDTIRRDLRELAQAGKLQRVHGAAMIQAGQVVILDGGTAAIQVARNLDPALRATIVTHSPTVAVQLASHPLIDIIMLGGRLFRHSMVGVGASVMDAASRLRALHERAAETIVLASSEKLLAASPFLVAPLRELSLLVVPANTHEKTIRALRTGDVKVSKSR